MLEQHCTHVTGDYYRVWPAVFHANLALVERGTEATVWGIAQRSLPTADRWTQVPLAETRIAQIVGDEASSQRDLKALGIEPVFVAYEGRGIRVLRPAAPLSACRAATRR